MKKTILALFVLIGLASSAKAQVITSAQAVRSVVTYQTTCSSTTVGVTASELTNNTTSQATTGGISNIKVVNMDATQTVCCSHSAGVTCITGAATDGDPIAPTTGEKNFLSWPISITQKWYCIATVAGVGIVYCKMR